MITPARLRRALALAVAPLVLAVTAFAFAGPAVADTAPPTGYIRGTVYAGSGSAPAQPGEVTISYEFSSDNVTWTAQPTTATTGSSGSFVLSSLPYGHYRITFTDPTNPNLVPYVANLDSSADSVHQYNQILLAGTSTISGTVLVNDHTNANPRPATAGEVDVVLIPMRDGGPVEVGVEPSAMTDASGGFTFTGVDTADFAYTLRFDYKGADKDYFDEWWGQTFTSQFSWTPIAPKGAAIPPLEFTMQHPNVLEGTLVDSSSRPVAGFGVCLVQQSTPTPFNCGQSIQALTDSSGHYVLKTMYDGSYAVGFVPVGTGPSVALSGQLWKGRNTFASPTLIAVAGHGDVTGFDATLLKDNTITATVSVQGMSAAQAASNGTGSVDVQQLDTATNKWIDSGQWQTTDAAGHATISSLLPGTYRVDLKYEDSNHIYVHKLSDPVTFSGEGQNKSVSASLFQPIRPGTTVKTSTSSTVYLVDGSTKLVPVGSMSTLIDLGFSTKPIVYDASRLASYTIASGRLSDAISCLDGGLWIGAAGTISPIDPYQGRGLEHTAPGITTLDDTTCGVLKKSADAFYYTPPMISVHGSPTVYTIGADGKKHAFLNGTDLRYEAGETYYDVPFILYVSSYYLNGIATGGVHLPSGRLVKTTTSSSVYVTDGQSLLLPLTSFGVATDAGLSSQYDTVTASQLSGYTKATTPFRNVFVCSGDTRIAGAGHVYSYAAALVKALPKVTLDRDLCDVIPVLDGRPSNHALFVKSASSSTIYNVNAAGQKQRVFSMATVTSMSAPDTGRYLTVNDQFLASMPNGTDLVNAGLLVKSPTSTSVYVADGAGALIPLRSFTTASDLGLSTHYVTTTAATMKTLKVSGAALNNLVTCSGKTWIGGAGKLWSIDPSAVGSLQVSALPASLCAALPKSSAALGTAVFIKGSTSATVYTLEAGVKHPVSAWATLVRLAGSKPVTVLSVDPGFIGRIPTGTVRK